MADKFSDLLSAYKRTGDEAYLDRAWEWYKANKNTPAGQALRNLGLGMGQEKQGLTEWPTTGSIGKAALHGLGSGAAGLARSVEGLGKMGQLGPVGYAAGATMKGIGGAAADALDWATEKTTQGRYTGPGAIAPEMAGAMAPALVPGMGAAGALRGAGVPLANVLGLGAGNTLAELGRQYQAGKIDLEQLKQVLASSLAGGFGGVVSGVSTGAAPAMGEIGRRAVGVAGNLATTVPVDVAMGMPAEQVVANATQNAVFEALFPSYTPGAKPTADGVPGGAGAPEGALGPKAATPEGQAKEQAGVEQETAKAYDEAWQKAQEEAQKKLIEDAAIRARDIPGKPEDKGALAAQFAAKAAEEAGLGYTEVVDLKVKARKLAEDDAKSDLTAPPEPPPEMPEPDPKAIEAQQGQELASNMQADPKFAAETIKSAQKTGNRRLAEAATRVAQGRGTVADVEMVQKGQIVRPVAQEAPVPPAPESSLPPPPEPPPAQEMPPPEPQMAPPPEMPPLPEGQRGPGATAAAWGDRLGDIGVSFPTKKAYQTFLRAVDPNNLQQSPNPKLRARAKELSDLVQSRWETAAAKGIKPARDLHVDLDPVTNSAVLRNRATGKILDATEMENVKRGWDTTAEAASEQAEPSSPRGGGYENIKDLPAREREWIIEHNNWLQAAKGSERRTFGTALGVGVQKLAKAPRTPVQLRPALRAIGTRLAETNGEVLSPVFEQLRREISSKVTVRNDSTAAVLAELFPPTTPEPLLEMWKNAMVQLSRGDKEIAVTLDDAIANMTNPNKKEWYLPDAAKYAEGLRVSNELGQSTLVDEIKHLTKKFTSDFEQLGLAFRSEYLDPTTGAFYDPVVVKRGPLSPVQELLTKMVKRVGGAPSVTASAAGRGKHAAMNRWHVSYLTKDKSGAWVSANDDGASFLTRADAMAFFAKKQAEASANPEYPRIKSGKNAGSPQLEVSAPVPYSHQIAEGMIETDVRKAMARGLSEAARLSEVTRGVSKLGRGLIAEYKLWKLDPEGRELPGAVSVDDARALNNRERGLYVPIDDGKSPVLQLPDEVWASSAKRLERFPDSEKAGLLDEMGQLRKMWVHKDLAAIMRARFGIKSDFAEAAGLFGLESFARKGYTAYRLKRHVLQTGVENVIQTFNDDVGVMKAYIKEIPSVTKVAKMMLREAGPVSNPKTIAEYAHSYLLDPVKFLDPQSPIPEEVKQLFKLADDGGVFETSFMSASELKRGPLDQSLYEMAQGSQSSIPSLLGEKLMASSGRTGKTARFLNRKASAVEQLYHFEDIVPKLVALKFHIESGMDSPAALKRIKDLYFDASNLPPVVQGLSRYIPFAATVSYNWKRTFENHLLNYGPEHAKKFAWKAAALFGSGWLGAQFSQWANIKEEDRKAMGDYGPGPLDVVLPDFDGDGKYTTIPLAWFYPGGELFFLNDILFEEGSIGRKLARRLTPLTWQPAETYLSGRDRFDRQIEGEGIAPGVTKLKIADEALSTFLPQVFYGNYSAYIGDLFKGPERSKDWYLGVPISPLSMIPNRTLNVAVSQKMAAATQKRKRREAAEALRAQRNPFLRQLQQRYKNSLKPD